MYLRQRKHDFRAKSSKTLREREDSEDDDAEEDEEEGVPATKTWSPFFRDLSADRGVFQVGVFLILVKTTV